MESDDILYVCITCKKNGGAPPFFLHVMQTYKISSDSNYSSLLENGIKKTISNCFQTRISRSLFFFLLAGLPAIKSKALLYEYQLPKIITQC